MSDHCWWWWYLLRRKWGNFRTLNLSATHGFCESYIIFHASTEDVCIKANCMRIRKPKDDKDSTMDSWRFHVYATSIKVTCLIDLHRDLKRVWSIWGSVAMNCKSSVAAFTPTTFHHPVKSNSIIMTLWGLVHSSRAADRLLTCRSHNMYFWLVDTALRSPLQMEALRHSGRSNALSDACCSMKIWSLEWLWWDRVQSDLKDRMTDISGSLITPSQACLLLKTVVVWFSGSYQTVMNWV